MKCSRLPFIHSCVLAFAFVVVLVAVSGLSAEELSPEGAFKKAVGEQHQILKNKLKDAHDKIAQWDREYLVLLSMNLLIAVLGATVAALQALRQRRWRVVAAILGLLVSTFSGAIQAFPEDARAIRRKIVTANGVLTRIESRLPLYDALPSDEERGRFVEELLEQAAKIDELESEVFASSVSSDFIPVVQAQAIFPSWVSSPPSDRVNLYFVGTGAGTSLNEARDNSFRDAQGKATMAVACYTNGVASDALSRYVQRYAVAADVSFDYEIKTKEYRYYTLLKLSRSVADSPLVRSGSIAGLPRVEGRLNVSWPSPRTNTARAVLRVQARNAKDGDFRFMFEITTDTQQDRIVKLQRVEVHQDGSRVGSMRWIFNVCLNDQPGFKLAERRYSDSGKPGVVTIRAEDGAAAPVPKPALGKADRREQAIQQQAIPRTSTGGFEIRVVGYQPKDIPE